MLGREPFELGRQLTVPSELELRLDPLLDGFEPQPFQPGDLGRREGLVRELGERRSAPELERLPERLPGPRFAGEPGVLLRSRSKRSASTWPASTSST
jgi:hypothetical protein